MLLVSCACISNLEGFGKFSSIPTSDKQTKFITSMSVSNLHRLTVPGFSPSFSHAVLSHRRHHHHQYHQSIINHRHLKAI